MTHEEQRVWLIQELLNEQPEYRRYKIPAAEQEQKDLSICRKKMQKQASWTLRIWLHSNAITDFISGREI